MSAAVGPQTTPGHLDALTGIRGIAAWFVVLFHVRGAMEDSLPGWAMVLADHGFLAVDLFFILSGFVLWYNYGERLRGTGMSGALRFWWKRIARIWPLHAVILTGFILLYGLLAVTGRDTSAYVLADLPFHILLIQNWGWTNSLMWNDPAWSISSEMGAYVLFPALAAVCHWARLSSWALSLMAMGLCVAIWAWFAAAGSPWLGYHIPQMGLGRCLIEFSLGNVLCLLWQRWWAIGWAQAAAVLAAAAGFAAGWWWDLPETMVIPGSFAALILALALDRGLVSRVLGSRVLTYLGEISYSTYLSHYLLFILFKFAFVKSTPMIGMGQLLAFIVLVAGASVVLYHGVEKPAQRWLNSWTLARGRRVQPA